MLVYILLHGPAEQLGINLGGKSSDISHDMTPPTGESQRILCSASALIR